VSDVDLFELNEAFAAQSLAVIKDLGLDPSKVSKHQPGNNTNSMIFSTTVSKSPSGLQFI
jgi:acetyl-CoA acetyltransferase